MSEHLINTLTPGTLDPGRERVVAWLRAHNVNPAYTYRVELYGTDELTVFARVYQFARNASGHGYLTCEREDPHEAADCCDVARREPYDVSIFSISADMADRMKAFAETVRAAHRALQPLLILLRASNRRMRVGYRRRQRARARSRR